MSEVIILGAGAIGRGYLPWVFSHEGSEGYQYIFIDSNPQIINQMNQLGTYDTYRVKNHVLEKKTVPIHRAYLPCDFKVSSHPDVVAVFMNVGPRNVVSAARLVESLDCPIILSENDPATVETVKSSTRLKKVYFAVPDVITSNSAPQYLLDKDPLSVITEDGTMFIDSQVGDLLGEYQACSEKELKQQWTAKLYLHNTPHCVAAYLGSLAKVTYVHEAMAIPEIKKIVSGCMGEMLNSLKLKWDISHSFLDWYAEKELVRFSNELLFDPISRVAREPIRKLESDGRLLGAAQICMSLGFIPENILLGIGSALLFDESNDADYHIVFMRQVLSPSSLFSHVLGLRKGEALERVLLVRLGQIFQKLKGLVPKGVDSFSRDALRVQASQTQQWRRESELALEAVSSAEQFTLNRPERLEITTKESARDVVTEVDRQIEAHLLSVLKQSGHEILAEESYHQEQNKLVDQATPLWLVDAIDGTANYVSGLPHFAISVGLLHQDEFKVGVVALPAFSELYFTYYGSNGMRSYLNGKLLQIPDAPLLSSLVGVSFSGRSGDPEFRELQYKIFGVINDSSRGCLRLGSAASNICAVTAGTLQAAYGFSAQLWDVAGGLAIAKNAGALLFWKHLPHSSQCHYIVGAPAAAEALRELFETKKWMEFR